MSEEACRGESTYGLHKIAKAGMAHPGLFCAQLDRCYLLTGGVGLVAAPVAFSSAGARSVMISLSRAF